MKHLIFLFPVSLGIFLRLSSLGSSPFWSDEISTVFYLTNKDPHSILWDANIPTYLGFLRTWISFVPLNEFTLRLPSALFSILSLLLFAKLLIRSLPNVQAFCALLLFAVNPLSVWYAGEARAYALLELAGVITLFSIANDRENSKPPIYSYLPFLPPLIHSLGMGSTIAALVTRTRSWRNLFQVKYLAPITILILINFISIRRPSLTWLDTNGPLDWFERTLGSLQSVDHKNGLIVLALFALAIAAPRNSFKTYLFLQALFVTGITALFGKVVEAPRFWILLMAPLCLVSALALERARNSLLIRNGLIVFILILSATLLDASLSRLNKVRGGWISADMILGPEGSNIMVVGREELRRYLKSPRYKFLGLYDFNHEFSHLPQGSLVLTSLFNFKNISERVGSDHIKLLANFCSECFEPVTLLKVVGPTADN